MTWKIFAFFQAETATVHWTTVFTVVGVLSPIIITILGALLYRSKTRADVTKTLADADKTRAEIGKTELDKMVAVMDRAPAWFAQIETMHIKNLDNETKIENQEKEINKLIAKCEIVAEDLVKCRDGEASCKETKTNVKIFLSNIESYIKQYPDSAPLIAEIQIWLHKL